MVRYCCKKIVIRSRCLVKKDSKRKKGFTLIELLAVIVVLGVVVK